VKGIEEREKEKTRKEGKEREDQEFFFYKNRNRLLSKLSDVRNELELKKLLVYRMRCFKFNAVAYLQGDQIGRFFAYREIVYFG
jgi:hypothetical protein